MCVDIFTAVVKMFINCPFALYVHCTEVMEILA